MATTGRGKPSCPDTGLAVPECSCTRCLEAMLREFHPAVRPEDVNRIMRYERTVTAVLCDGWSSVSYSVGRLAVSHAP